MYVCPIFHSLVKWNEYKMQKKCVCGCNKNAIEHSALTFLWPLFVLLQVFLSLCPFLANKYFCISKQTQMRTNDECLRVVCGYIIVVKSLACLHLSVNNKYFSPALCSFHKKSHAHIYAMQIFCLKRRVFVQNNFTIFFFATLNKNLLSLVRRREVPISKLVAIKNSVQV